MAGSGKYNDVGYPFGYLKASSTNQVVNLIVMPYNYPLLVPLLGMYFIVMLRVDMQSGPLCFLLSVFIVIKVTQSKLSLHWIATMLPIFVPSHH